MKIKQTNRLCASLLAAVALLGAVTLTKAATPLDDTVNFTNSFDNSASVASWIYWYGNGSNNNNMTWDATVDAANNPNSGSLLFETTFPPANQLAWFGTFHNRWGYDTDQTHDASKYTNIVVDIHVDPSSVLSTAGTFGDLQYGFFGGPQYNHSVTIPATATNGWTHLVMPIDPTQSGLAAVSGLAFRIQSYDSYHNPVGYLKFWMDNLKMIVSPVAIPPPKLSTPFEKPIQGLNMISSASGGGEFQRSSIFFKQHVGVGWLGSPDPVTYSLTITNFPSGFYSNYQAHIFITTGPEPPSFESASDYNEANVIFFDVHQNFDGTGNAYFRYKVNEANANTNMFGPEYIGLDPATNSSAGTLTNLPAATVFGTWSITFSQDTNVTLSGPGGVSRSFTLRPAAAAYFTDPLNVLWGGQPNRQSDANPLVNVGQRVVIAAVGITNGLNTIVSDNFMADTVLDTSTFGPLAGDVNMVQLVPAGSAFWLKWSLPDQSFGLQTKTNLSPAVPWTTLTGPDAGNATLQNYPVSGGRLTLIPTSALGSTSQNYFRLIKEDYVKLQILMPGETAAPGTPTGKTGTPTPQQVGVPFQVTVNAVDNRWYPISTVGDTVHFTSSDTLAGLSADGALVNGSGGFDAVFNTSGPQTITVSDASDATKTAGTSASTTVNP